MGTIITIPLSLYSIDATGGSQIAGGRVGIRSAASLGFMNATLPTISIDNYGSRSQGGKHV